MDVPAGTETRRLGVIERPVERLVYPSQRCLEQLRTPPSPTELIADAEPRVFVD